MDHLGSSSSQSEETMDHLGSSSSLSENDSGASIDALVRGINPLIEVLTSKIARQDDARDIEQGDHLVEGANGSESLSHYLPLYKAALAGDWEKAKTFFESDDQAVKALITFGKETTLHLAVRTGRSMVFVQNLLKLMSEDVLEYKDNAHHTALVVSVIVNNIEAAKLLASKHPGLLFIEDEDGILPVHFAAKFGHREMLVYLYNETKTKFGNTSIFFTQYGPKLLSYMIISGFVDIALDVVHSHPELATASTEPVSPLGLMAAKPELFRSGSNLNFWHRQIYSCIPTPIDALYNSSPTGLEDRPDSSPGVDTPLSSLRRQFSNFGGIVWHKLNIIFWLILSELVPCIKYVRQTKLLHYSSVEIVKFMSQEIAKLHYPYAKEGFELAFMSAAKSGVHEVVEEIIYSFPHAIWFCDRNTKRYVFEEAIKERHENVFNLVYQTSGNIQNIAQSMDKDNNNILHLAGHLAPQHKISRIPGAALQMQRELQWFKEVEKFVKPIFSKLQNNDGKTPRTVFSEEHKHLVIEGEKWMKSTASSCSLVAALIAMVVFQAAISVPGSYNPDGHPNFSSKKTFTFFAVSDAISFLWSTIAILMFTSILTARYAEDDFLYALPKRLIVGELSLLISIATMMMAFVSSIILVFGISKELSVLVSIIACLPVSFFAFSQGRSLVNMIRSTYGRGIFGKQSDRILY